MSTLIIFSPHRSANARHASLRIIVPCSSSFTSSQSTPACGRPVSTHRSTPDSVCPRRVRTPPGRARSGTMCPGREKDEGEEILEDASARAVSALSCADIPVVRKARTLHGERASESVPRTRGVVDEVSEATK